MKVFLAGAEQWYFAQLPILAKQTNLLFSYYHWNNLSPRDHGMFSEVLANPELEVICDSGLFTLMFGAGKGGSYDFEYMKNYTKTYIAKAKQFKIKNLTIVESDVHKLLGMKAVYELRRLFEDCGMKVLYVWHREEGIDGLIDMANKYDYIAISVPELRILFKGSTTRYQDAVKDLLQKIKAGARRMPRIHLLGNTIQETMETSLAYSCDSTSWLSGGRYGTYLHFDGRNIRPHSIYNEEYANAKYLLENRLKREMTVLRERWEAKGKSRQDYMVANYLSARSFSLYQQWLDKNFKCVEETNAGRIKRKDGGHRKA